VGRTLLGPGALLSGMPDGEGGPGTDASGSDPLAAPRPPLEPLPSTGAVPAPMVLGYVDLAISGTLEYERYKGVYLGPWWKLENVPDGMHVWKRAVLHRTVGRGAEHWGHLFLIVRYETREMLSWFSKDLRGRQSPAFPSESIVLRRGDQTAELATRPTATAEAGRLDEFAREVSERFRRQMD
jgi:hypothetical protein